MKFHRRPAPSSRAWPAALGALLALALAAPAAENGFEPFAFFHKPLEEIAAVVSSARNPRAAAESLVAQDTRHYAKVLRELFRIFRDRYGAVMEKDMRLVHALDRSLGLCADDVHTSSAALAGGAPPQLIATLGRSRSCENLEALLVRDGWMNGSALHGLLSDLDRISWDAGKRERAYVLKELRSRLQKIKSRDYEVSTLEGMHRLRRALRSFLLEVQGFHGLTVLDPDDCPVSRYRAVINIPVEEEPRPPLDAGGAAPIRVPECLYREIAKMVEILGDAKDFELRTQVLAKAALESGLVADPGQAQVYARNILSAQPGAAGAEDAGPNVLMELRGSKILEALIKELRRQR